LAEAGNNLITIAFAMSIKNAPTIGTIRKATPGCERRADSEANGDYRHCLDDFVRGDRAHGFGPLEAGRVLAEFDSGLGARP
jgi:hypothetical protein